MDIGHHQNATHLMLLLTIGHINTDIDWVSVSPTMVLFVVSYVFFSMYHDFSRLLYMFRPSKYNLIIIFN